MIHLQGSCLGRPSSCQRPDFPLTTRLPRRSFTLRAAAAVMAAADLHTLFCPSVSNLPCSVNTRSLEYGSEKCMICFSFFHSVNRVSCVSVVTCHMTELMIRHQLKSVWSVSSSRSDLPVSSLHLNFSN